MKTLITTLTLALLVVAAGIAFVYFGVVDISADTPHNRPLTRLLETVRERSIAVRATGIEVPALDDAALIATGAKHYDAMCSGCHLAPGMDDNEFRAGLYPQPPNLAVRKPGNGHHNVAEAAARQFWVIKHGIKFTAMPAWGTSHDDGEIWALVAFVQKLPELTAQQYEAMSSSSSEHEHGGGHEHGGEAEHKGGPEHKGAPEHEGEPEHESGPEHEGGHEHNAGHHDAAVI